MIEPENERRTAKSIASRLKVLDRIEMLCKEVEKPFEAPPSMLMESSLKYIPPAAEIAANPTNPIDWIKLLLDQPADLLIGWYRRRPIRKLVRTAKQVVALDSYGDLLIKHFGPSVAMAVDRGCQEDGTPEQS
jgi:hypothetical protein